MCKHDIPFALQKLVVTDLGESMSKIVLQLLKQSYLHYRNVYGHQTWQEVNFLWGNSTHKVKWHFDHLVLRDHVTN